MKDLYGKPQSLYKNLRATMGLDWKWWVFPSRPLLKINYYERLYTIKMIQKKRVFEEDDSDPENKILAKERAKVDFEKKLIYLSCAGLLAAWFIYFRHKTTAYFI